MQKLENEIKALEEDYNHIGFGNLCYGDRWGAEWFNGSYEKDLRRIIKHRILKLKRKRKEMIDNDG